MKWLSILLCLSLIFCATSIGIFFIHLDSSTKKITASIQQTATTVQQTTKDVDEYTTSTLNDMQGVLEVAGDTLNEIQMTVKNEQKSIQEANKETISTMQNLNTLILHLDANQDQVTLSLQQTLKSVQETTAATVPVVQQAQKDLADLEPILAQANSTMTNVAASTEDIKTEIHKFVYPPPQKWYQKYLLSPLKLGLHMLTVPVTAF